MGTVKLNCDDYCAFIRLAEPYLPLYRLSAGHLYFKRLVVCGSGLSQ